MVVVKGTEFFDGKLGRYVDCPVTDVLQMMGRAGRPVSRRARLMLIATTYFNAGGGCVGWEMCSRRGRGPHVS